MERPPPVEQGNINGEPEESSQEVRKVIGVDGYIGQRKEDEKSQNLYSFCFPQGQEGFKDYKEYKTVGAGQKECNSIKKAYHSLSPQYSVSSSMNSFRRGWLMGRVSPVIRAISSFFTFFT